LHVRPEKQTLRLIALKRFAPFLIVTLAAIVTCTWATVLYRTKMAEHERLDRAKAAEAAERKKAAHVLGNPEAGVTIEEYGDFQCPPCGLLADPLSDIVRDFRPNVRLIFHNFPLPVHAHAKEAAAAAEAAGLQGKFWEMHDLLYREQPAWSKATNIQELLMAYATKVGLDTKKFALDLISENTQERVEKDEREGKKLGVTNTPTLFINDHAVAPKDLAPASVRNAIESLLQPSPSPSGKK